MKIQEINKINISDKKPPLLTICIPTYNRGKKALSLVNTILKKLNTNCSIFVLDNASNNEKKYYKKIKKLANKHTDKLKYVRHSHNRMFHGNYLACFELSESKYSMVISDEDIPELKNIKTVLKQFKENKNLGIVRGSISTVKGVNVGNAQTYETNYLIAGEDALSNYGFSNNYHSGTVYNNKLIKKYNLLKRLKKNLDKQYIYPHLYFELLISSKSDVVSLSDIIIYEGQAQAITNENDELENDINAYKIPYSFGARLDQFVVLRDAMAEAVQLIDGDIALYANLYLKLVEKYFYLITKCDSFLFINNKLNVDFLRKSMHSMAYAGISEYHFLKPFHDKIFAIIDKISDEYK